jgi:hypothetical protein
VSSKHRTNSGVRCVLVLMTGVLIAAILLVLIHDHVNMKRPSNLKVFRLS